MADRDLITAEELRQILHYDPETGLLTWTRSRGRARIGRVAGYLHHIGYVCVELSGRAYPAHRIAWLWMTGEWPKDQIDHRNMIKADNRWENLREATDVENRLNRKVRVDNRSGYKGVSERNHNGVIRYVAEIAAYGKQRYLGFFKTPEEAHEAYKKAAVEMHGEFVNFG